MNLGRRLDPKTTRDALTDHPYYRYRGCAPDPDNPKVAAGNPELPVTSWDPPDVDGGEPQAQRIARERAAIEVCNRCPVKRECLAYGSSLTPEGRLAEPYAILGGTTALERHKALIRARQQEPARPKTTPIGQLRTAQKLAVLRALARHTDAEVVAAAAGMDVRTANWQRSILVGKLGLPRDATRMQLLQAAAAVGLLDVAVAADDGSVPAVPPPSKTATSGPRQQSLTVPPPSSPPSAQVPGSGAGAVGRPRRSRRRRSRPAGASGGRTGRFTTVTGQLTLDLTPEPAGVAQLPTRTPVRLEAAA